MPRFEVTVITTRAGTHTVCVEAASASAARGLVQSECVSDRCHCPTEWCTDDVESDVLSVREVGQGACKVDNEADSSTGARAVEPDRVGSEC